MTDALQGQRGAPPQDPQGALPGDQLGQAVLNLGGTLDYFIESTFNYPTLAEAYKIAALDAWNRIAPRRGSAPEVAGVSG